MVAWQRYVPLTLMQAADAPHALPQAPQLAARVRSVSQPFALLPSQFRWLPSQTGAPQAPFAQLAEVAPAFEQVPVQLPQCWMLLDVSVSQPSAPSTQWRNCPWQEAIVQLDFSQAETAFGASQAFPQPPQFFGSVVVFTSQPL